MANRRTAAKPHKKVGGAAKPPSYLPTVMFRASEVKGRKLEQDNMEYIHPRCINNVSDGDELAVYEFVGIKKVRKHVTFEDTGAAKKAS